MCGNADRGAMNITLRAGWNALDAMLQETHINNKALHHQVLSMYVLKKLFQNDYIS